MSPDLKTKQSVPRNTAAKSPASTKRRKSDSTGRQNRALTSFLLGVDPSKPPRQPNQRSAHETARNISHCPHLPMLPYSPIVNPPPKSKSHQSTKHRRLKAYLDGRNASPMPEQALRHQDHSAKTACDSRCEQGAHHQTSFATR